MSGAKVIVPILVMAASLMAPLYPLAGGAQQVNSSLAAGGVVNFSAQNAGGVGRSAQPTASNPFERPWGDNYEASTQPADILISQMDRNWISSAAVYAFSAAPAFYATSFNAVELGAWDSLLSGAITAHLNRTNTTGLRMSSDLESYGQRRTAGGSAQPGGQSLTVEWELSQLLPSKFGVLELAAGTYQQQMISYRDYANGPLTNVLLGYTASAIGFETSVTLPEKNMTCSFRYGKEHVSGEIVKSHVAVFELSWTW